ncbi:amylo-alpha-1,6-glucosidase [Thermaurantiacus sp.]
MRALFGSGVLFRVDGVETSHIRADAGGVAAEMPGGRSLEIVMDGDRAMRVRARGGGVRLVGAPSFQVASPVGKGVWRLVCPALDTGFWLVGLAGEISVKAGWDGVRCEEIEVQMLPKPEDNEAELALLETEPGCEYVPMPFQPIKECRRQNLADFSAFHKDTLSVPAEYADAAELASFIHWSCLVRPRGRLLREAMYMSKNWMTAVWSWDHAINALALARTNPELAWDQLAVLFESRNSQGSLPDHLSDRSECWAFVKPPIHGWVIGRMLKLAPAGFFDRKRLEEAYVWLSDQARYWLDFRKVGGECGLVYYHGNDSGWDNSTVFLHPTPAASPDLPAFLILQVETLAELASLLGREDRGTWLKTRNDLWDIFVKRTRNFSLFDEPTDLRLSGDSLLPFMAIVLGHRLESSQIQRIVAGLQVPHRFRTAWGLATENLRSPWYESDGYWRGPIWAPSTLLVVEGLIDAGESRLAQELAKGFCQMCLRNGFAENFDAVTGEGLRDRAFTWTASTFLLLANRLATQSFARDS